MTTWQVMNCYKEVLFEQHGQNVYKKTVVIYTDLQKFESFQLWDVVEFDEMQGFEDIGVDYVCFVVQVSKLFLYLEDKCSRSHHHTSVNKLTVLSMFWYKCMNNAVLFKSKFAEKLNNMRQG